ncbi:MAG: ABC transporter permease, partial [Pararhizobium sp.]
MSVNALFSSTFDPDGDAPQPNRQNWGGQAAAIALRGGSFIAFAAILLYFSIAAPFFFTLGNIGNVLG